YWIMMSNPEANFDELEKNGSVNKVIIKQDDDWDDRYLIYFNDADPPALVTIKPEKYQFLKK
ncbi:hypothetical protein OEK97_28345, partial [Escherichia coli]|uniref:hypothetical protein n=1 Tax=Escherichia coli TaxID=562 RepID=UPI0021D814E5